MGRLSSRGFRAGSLLAGGWGWVMGFCISGFTFLWCLVGVFGVWLGFLVFDVVNDGDGNVEV